MWTLLSVLLRKGTECAETAEAGQVVGLGGVGAAVYSVYGRFYAQTVAGY